MELPNTPLAKQLISQAITEDLSRQDVTTRALIPETEKGKALIIAKGKGVIAGTEIAKQVFLKVDPKLEVDILIHDGAEVRSSDIIARIEGKTSSMLKAERVALNFLQHLSGIASEEGGYAQRV